MVADRRPPHLQVRRRMLAWPLAALSMGKPVLAAPQTSHAGLRLNMMIPAKPGGGWDTTGRALGAGLQQAGANVTVNYDNKGGGAAGTIGLAQFLAHSKGDPHALMVMGAVMLGGLILDKTPVRLDQATPVARLASEYNVFVLPPKSPFKSWSQVVQQMKREPGSVRFGGGSRGSTEHIAVAMLARSIGIDPGKINYIAFRGGGEATAAILEGYVSVGGSGLSELKPYIQQGRVRALALTSPDRLAGMDIPTLRELGLDLVIGNWRGVYGAPGISAAQSRALIELVSRATETSTWAEALQRHSWTPALLTGPAFGEFVAGDMSRLRHQLGALGMA